MTTESIVLLAATGVAYAPVLFGAALMLIGRRAGWFGIVASIVFIIYLVLVNIFFVGFGVLCLFLILGTGMLVYAYRRYRQGRQEEVFQVIATAVESNVPLAPAMRAYLLDRPREGRALWDAGLFLACPPGYVVWTLRRTFDDRVAHLSALLAAGAPLAIALRIARGVVPPEVTVAAEVGDTTGRLAVCLRRAERDRLAGAWLEVLPRVLYPMVLLLFICFITVFLSVMIVPKFKKIFDDFHEKLPPITDRLFGVMDAISDYAGLSVALLIVGFMGVCGVAGILVFVPSVRWHLPIFGRMFRWEAQGLVLRMLGTLFEVGRPAPEALGLLANASDLSPLVRKRLERAMVKVKNGETLATALRTTGLLPARMTSLLRAAERTHTLPQVLFDLGDLLAGKAVRLARRISFVIAPILIVAVGLLVGLICVGMFLPLIQLLTGMTV